MYVVQLGFKGVIPLPILLNKILVWQGWFIHEDLRVICKVSLIITRKDNIWTVYEFALVNWSHLKVPSCWLPCATSLFDLQVESRCNLVPTSAEALHTQLNSCQAITSLMSVQPGRPLPQSHLYNSTSPQPPPIKKMAPMASHFGDATMRCFSTPYVTGNMKPAVMPASICPSSRGPGLALLAGNPHDLRFKLEHERLATNIANIAPPTPPATPSAGSN